MGNGDGKLDSDLSIVSIVDLYPREHLEADLITSPHNEHSTSASIERDSIVTPP